MNRHCSSREKKSPLQKISLLQPLNNFFIAILLLQILTSAQLTSASAAQEPVTTHLATTHASALLSTCRSMVATTAWVKQLFIRKTEI